jgi:hypothetical protein
VMNTPRMRNCPGDWVAGNGLQPLPAPKMTHGYVRGARYYGQRFSVRQTVKAQALLVGLPDHTAHNRISSDCSGFQLTETLPEPFRLAKKGPPPRA